MLYLDLAIKLLDDNETRAMLFAADEFRRIVAAEQIHVALLQNHRSTPTVVFRQSLAFFDRLPPTSPFLIGCVCSALSRCASVAAMADIYDHLWRALLQETRQPTRPRPYVPLTDPASNATAAATALAPSSSSSSVRGAVTRQQQQQQQQQQQHSTHAVGTHERHQSQPQPHPHDNSAATQHRVSTPKQDPKSSKTTSSSSSSSPSSRLRQHQRAARGLGLGLEPGPPEIRDEEEDLGVDIADDDGESGDEDGNHYIDHLLQLPDFHRPLQGTIIIAIIIIIITISIITVLVISLPDPYYCYSYPLRTFPDRNSLYSTLPLPFPHHHHHHHHHHHQLLHIDVPTVSNQGVVSDHHSNQHHHPHRLHHGDDNKEDGDYQGGNNKNARISG